MLRLKGWSPGTVCVNCGGPSDAVNVRDHLSRWPVPPSLARPQAILYQDTPLFMAEACSLTALHGGCPGAKVCQYRTLQIEGPEGKGCRRGFTDLVIPTTHTSRVDNMTGEGPALVYPPGIYVSVNGLGCRRGRVLMILPGYSSSFGGEERFIGYPSLSAHTSSPAPAVSIRIHAYSI